MAFESKVMFRVDASRSIGNGHLMRSMALAKGLKQCGIECLFVSQDLDGNLIKYLESNDFEVMRINNEKSGIKVVSQIRPKLLVIDHYKINSDAESSYRNYVKKLFVIDDLANRKHNCDILLDQNLGRKRNDYRLLVEEKTKLLIGPKFALTRDEFFRYRKISLNRRGDNFGQPLKVLVSMGGTDQGGYTSKAIEAIASSGLHSDTVVTILISSNSSNISKIRKSLKLLKYPSNLIIDPSNIAELMAYSDFSIGALGSTSWERCILGLPSISVCVAKNQKSIGESLAKAGASLVIGRKRFKEDLIEELSKIKNGESFLSKQSRFASTICDGFGVQRVIGKISEIVF